MREELNGVGLGFTAILLSPESPLPVLTPLSDILDIWKSKRSSDLIPAWRNFELADFRGWAGRIAVSECKPDELEPIFRLCGDQFNESQGRNMQGQHFGVGVDSRHRMEMVTHFYTMRMERLMGFCSGTLLRAGADEDQFEAIELPIADEDGTPRFILHAFLTQRIATPSRWSGSASFNHQLKGRMLPQASWMNSSTDGPRSGIAAEVQRQVLSERGKSWGLDISDDPRAFWNRPRKDVEFLG